MSDAHPNPGPDRRVERTRRALVGAFNVLVLTKGYDAIGPAEIAEAANVARSTFYEHFGGKEDLLAQSIVAVLTPLAGAVAESAPIPDLERVIQHFWQNRRLAVSIMTGRSRVVMARRLSELIEAELRDADSQHLPESLRTLAAIQIAHGQIALLEAWLSGRHSCTATELAAWISSSSRAVAVAPYQG